MGFDFGAIWGLSGVVRWKPAAAPARARFGRAIFGGGCVLRLHFVHIEPVFAARIAAL